MTNEDIRRAVSHNAYRAGLDYYEQGRVRTLAVTDGGQSIEATVRGSGATYDLHVTLGEPTDGERVVAGMCTCPVGYNCKHVAALLFAAKDRLRAVPAKPPRAEVKAAEAGAPAAPPLPPEVDAWLRLLEAAREEESEAYPPGIRKRLFYVFRPDNSGGLDVELHSVEQLKSGSLGRLTTRFQAYDLLRHGQSPKFLRPSDLAILRRLAGLPRTGEEFVETVRRMIATGRARWAAWTGPVVSEGPSLPGELVWHVADDGRQRPELAIEGRPTVVSLASPWYVDPATGVMGPIETRLAPRLVDAVLRSPTLPIDVAGRVRAEMERRWPDAGVPTPVALPAPRRLREKLRPHLRLFAGELPFDPAAFTSVHRCDSPPRRTPLARLSWQYGDVRMPGIRNGPRKSVVRHDGTLFEVERHFKAEAAAAELVRQAGLKRVGDATYKVANHPHVDDLTLFGRDADMWPSFAVDAVAWLRENGCLVEIDDDFPWRVVRPETGVSFELTEGSGIDWLELDLGVMVDGVRVSLIPALADLIARGGSDLAQTTRDAPSQRKEFLLRLPDGRQLLLPREQLQPILAPLLELFAGRAADGAIRVQRRDAGDLAELEAAGAAAGVVWQGGEAVRALGRQLREHAGIPPCAAPDGFGATLRGYQQAGLAWLQFLRAAGLGGVLADDMGLGKTVQALAHLAVEQVAGRLDRPALVVCPTSLVGNWRAEAARFAPALRVLVLHGPDRARDFEAIGAHDLVVTTYPLLSRDHAVLAAREWHVVLLDEAQTIKNPLATTSKLARTLQARQRLCLSGTPLENHLGELWSLFDFLSPGFLGDRKQFGARYRGPIEKDGNTERQTMLARRVAPFLLRRTKEQVAADLPDKTEITETVAMGEAQQAVYEAIRLTMHTRVREAVAARGLAGSGIVILDALLKLRQACCDPRLLKLEAARAAKAGSAKLERLLELLAQLRDEGRRVLLFSQFTSMLALIEAELAKTGTEYVLLTGDTRDRAGPIKRFQSGEVGLFLISLKAGGVGLNLTAADTVIHYDPWWNPAAENQATDRAHRIGQDKPVFVHRLITAGTIEEKMEVLKARKQALADGILGGAGGAANGLTEGDLEVLFAAA